jgi:cystathionine beta-lyase
MSMSDLNVDSLRQRRGEKWTQYPPDVLPCWVADMDFEIAQPIKDAIQQRIDRSDCGYPVAAQATGLPEIFCERVAERHQWTVTPDQVDLFNDVVQAIYFGLLALADEGEGVVIQTPIYPPFIAATTETKRRLVLCPLANTVAGYEIDFAQMRASIDENTSVLLLCNPHNPSGRCYTRAELEALAEIVVANDMTIISDEIHADLVFAPNKHIPIASLSPEVAARTVTLMSASKAFNIAGICMAFAVFGSAEMRKKFTQVPRHLRGGVSALSVAAVSAAFTAGQPWLDKTLAYLKTNRDFLAAHASANWPQVTHHRAQATYLAWFDFSNYDLPPSPYKFFLEHAKVALSDGARFGETGAGFTRLNYATSRPILQEALSRIDRSLAPGGR